MSKIDDFEKEIREQHDKLTREYEESQEYVTEIQAKHSQHKERLQAFRAKYGKVIEALDSAA